ncbi:MAG: hypothetical protein LBL39_07960 [Planctomycetaceae bacterium]|nr:hypothetical protein [Planctomycetaceae bacterium]
MVCGFGQVMFFAQAANLLRESLFIGGSCNMCKITEVRRSIVAVKAGGYGLVYFERSCL